MESGGLVGDCLSPESTVTSLLSSSGHLRSSLLVPEHNSTFIYRDKCFESASAALDAYIADFERSHTKNKSQPGRLVLPNNPAHPRSRQRVNTLRNRDVLRERLTDRELDFLNLPVSSLHHRSNRDRLSMTTNELLSIPNDGSMPVTHTSAFIQGMLSQSGSTQPHLSSARPADRTWDKPGSSLPAPQQNQHHHDPNRTHRSSRYRGRTGAAMLKQNVDFSSNSCYKSACRAPTECADMSSSLQLPHWFTSNKSEMDFSGITSVPDLKYPAWIQHCGVSHDLATPAPESELWDELDPRGRAPSWVEELQDGESDQTPSQADSQRSLRDLRLQFAEQISVLAASKKSSDIMENLCRDNRIESLILKADQVLNSLSQSFGRADSSAESVSVSDYVEDNISLVNKEEPQQHCRHLNKDSAAAAAAAGNISVDLTEQGAAQTCQSDFHGNSVLKQPGPAEALKQMLFRLQAVEAELQRRHQTPAHTSDRLQTEETPVKQRPAGEEEPENVSGSASLQRALLHLSRLKMLVDEPGMKCKVEEEEKDEDEGRYSSLSADGLACTQQKLS